MGGRIMLLNGGGGGSRASAAGRPLQPMPMQYITLLNAPINSIVLNMT
jgi:hypothetical protein